MFSAHWFRPLQRLDTLATLCGWRRNLSHNSLSCQMLSVSSKELALPRLIRYELSRLRCHGHSLLLSSYLCRIRRKENSSCSACEHLLQDMTHLLHDCHASQPLRRAIFGTTSSIFDLWSRPWGVARLLGLRGIPPHDPIPRKGSGSITTIAKSLYLSWYLDQETTKGPFQLRVKLPPVNTSQTTQR